MINYSENQRKCNDKSNGLIVGLVFVIAGIVLLLSNMDLITWQWKRVIISWQMLLIVIGIIQFSRNNGVAGTILVLLGGFFLLPKLSFIFPDWIRYNITKDFWPLLIVMVGLIIISAAAFSNNRRRVNYRNGGYRPPIINSDPVNPGNNGGHQHANTYSGINSENGYVNVSYVFSGSEQIFLEPVFRGGSIKTVFGGFTLDLRRTTLPDGISYLKVETIFGGTELIVPEDWHVEVSQNSFLGGFSNSRISQCYNPNKKLIIQATCIFGGGEVK